MKYKNKLEKTLKGLELKFVNNVIVKVIYIHSKINQNQEEMK